MRKSSCRVWGYRIKVVTGYRLHLRDKMVEKYLMLRRQTCGFSDCTRRVQFEPYTTVFSGMTSHVLIWQHAPTMQPLVRITFLPRSAVISASKCYFHTESQEILLLQHAGCRNVRSSVLPLDSITLLSPIFKAWLTKVESLRILTCEFGQHSGAFRKDM